MKRPVIDYHTFRLRKINEPEFAHLKLLLGWVGYFILYFLTEHLLPADACHPVHMWLSSKPSSAISASATAEPMVL